MIRLFAEAGLWLAVMAVLLTAGLGRVQAQPATEAPPPNVVIAEGEKFKTLDAKGWKVTPQDLSWASHTYGGMWVTHGALLGAPASSNGSVATQTVQIPTAGQYRVWSKYQAPPYFNYLHKIDVVQGGRTVYSYTYGKESSDRLWSFSGQSDVLWWPWGLDHDTAEAPKTMANLAAGPAEIRLSTVPNAAPAGDRMVDFIVLTTNPEDDYIGFKPYGIATPFANEALAATKLYMRFQNTTAAAAQVTLSRSGHFQPQYGGASTKQPAAPVAPGQWSEWFNIGPFVRLVHNEGVWVNLEGAAAIPVQIARDATGKDMAGDLKVPNGEPMVVPKEVTWDKAAKVRTSREHAAEVIALTKKWRTSNGGKKPQEIAYYGAFGNTEWGRDLKDALGYNTLLPDKYEHLKRDGYHQHVFGVDEIKAFAATVANKENFRVLSFGDEISLGEIDYNDPAMQTKFTAWLQAKKVTKEDIGVEPAQAKLSKTGDARIMWYSNLFNEEERFAAFRASTEAAKAAIGPHVLTGANYSPHHLALSYGPVFQWIDIFKHNGMNMFWAEDYIFSVPEVPQILSFMFAQMRAGTKYNKQPIHFYVMPHAPGQTAGNLRRSMVHAVGAGAAQIDSFWVGPEENFTENFVAWGYNDTFRVLRESILDSGEVEKVSVNGQVRPGRVAVVLSKATDFNESRLKIDKAKDPFMARSKNAPATIQQIICRKDQQMLYIALRNAQHGVDLITEDDIKDGYLKNYDVVYFAGEWVDHNAVKTIDAWVQNGGVLYATAGIGHLNEFNQPEAGLAKILGLKGSTTTKNLYVVRTLLELPLAQPIGTITMDGQKIPAIGMKQVLSPDTAKVLGTWEDGSAAVTVNTYGKGQAFAVGTLAGNSYMKTGLRLTPWARGGKKMVYNPVDFAPAATKLVRLGVDAKPIAEEVTCSNPFVEAIVIDKGEGTLVTLTNWTNAPVKNVTVNVKMPAAPKSARLVSAQKEVPVTYANGMASFTVDVAEADYVLLAR